MEGLLWHDSANKIKGITKWRETENEAIYMGDMDKARSGDNRSPLKVPDHKLNICILITLHGKMNAPPWMGSPVICAVMVNQMPRLLQGQNA